MPKYNKLNVADFRQKLKNGEYASLTGAKRAIGKMQEWSEKERDSARAAAAKHFGEDPAPIKKTAKKTVTKPVKEAAARKALSKKKAGKPQRGAVKKTSSVGPGKGRMKKAPKKAPKKAAKKAAKKAGSRAASRDSTSSGVTSETRLEQAQSTLTVLGDAAALLEKCRVEGSTNTNVTAGLDKIAETATRLVEDLDRNVVTQLTAAEARGAQLLAQTAPSHVPGNGSPPMAPTPPVHPPIAPQSAAAPVIPPTTR